MTTRAALAPVRFDHLHALRGRFGVFEHARLDQPRVAHGYCTDDQARVVVVLAGEGRDLAEPDEGLLATCLRFVRAGRVPGGWHNRMSPVGTWCDDRGSDDAHGRALWGLGVAATAGCADVLPFLTAGCDLDTWSPRANAYAVLGVAAAYRATSAPHLRDPLARFAGRVPPPGAGAWRWPEERLAYANARLPDALLAAGAALGDDGLIADGLDLLEWLVDVEMGDGCFSFTPVGGRGPGERGPAFDQQPIEAWAMADACARAFAVTGDRAWVERTHLAAEWFLGRNDTGAALYDPATGAGYDGLERGGVNRNRGAESTLAALGALQAARRVEA